MKSAATPYDGGRDEAVTPAERAPEVATVVDQVAGTDSHGGLAPNLGDRTSSAAKPFEYDSTGRLLTPVSRLLADEVRLPDLCAMRDRLQAELDTVEQAIRLRKENE